jgi:hypothetical protein
VLIELAQWLIELGILKTMAVFPIPAGIVKLFTGIHLQ